MDPGDGMIPSPGLLRLREIVVQIDAISGLRKAPGLLRKVIRARLERRCVLLPLDIPIRRRVDFRIPGVGVKGRQNQQYRDQKRNRRYDESRSFYGDSRIVRFH